MTLNRLWAVLLSVMLLSALPSAAKAAEGLNALTLKTVNAWKLAGHTEAQARRMRPGDCFVITTQSGSYRDCLRAKGDTVWARAHALHRLEQRHAANQRVDLSRFGTLSHEQQKSFRVAIQQFIDVRERATPAPQKRQNLNGKTAVVESDTPNKSGSKHWIASVALLLVVSFALWSAFVGRRKRKTRIGVGENTPVARAAAIQVASERKWFHRLRWPPW